MFGRKKRNKFIEVTKLSSLIADNLRVVGDVHFSGGMRVDGRVEGRVEGNPEEKSLIVLSEKGCVLGGVRSYDAVINGRIDGDLFVEHFLELQAGACISGNIRYRQLQMDCGATVEGKLVRMDEESASEARTAADAGLQASDPSLSHGGEASEDSKEDRPAVSARAESKQTASRMRPASPAQSGSAAEVAPVDRVSMHDEREH